MPEANGFVYALAYAIFLLLLLVGLYAIIDLVLRLFPDNPFIQYWQGFQETLVSAAYFFISDPATLPLRVLVMLLVLAVVAAFIMRRYMEK